ncbi:asparaginase-domain-containing protein [Zychaea mexicana]|uniref:asparaginase-domain-containing protein n=1 Tax=Zychaea mexicana TaxID=64656 RepID=UPI0022FE937F|nr:asparaginase-domain-containing protein [Zychaea mexicana]KAI9488399.1 asparaginase-domain-containing protein [Zychaea mexicana]
MLPPQTPRETTPEHFSNGHSVIYDNAAVEHQLHADRNEMVAPDFSRVLIIYTGGTIGMKHTTEHGYIPLPNYFAQTLAKVTRFHDSTHSRAPSPTEEERRLGTITNTVRTTDGKEVGLHELPSLITPVSLYGKRIRYSILEYDPLLDSCNMTMDDWVRIARDIEANYEYFDAFIVLHGTDTMAYTASALSFLLEDLGKTVIITGSQVPLTEVRNDAIDNLLGAITIAGHFLIPEVCLYFNQKLYRGNRTSKISAVDFDAFDSPNLPALVELGIDIHVKWPLVLRPTQIAKFRSHKVLNRNVASLRLFPGINESTVRAFLAPPIQGVVLETYGAGNAPARPDLLAALKEACDRGVVIVNCTQCRKGLVTDSYATGRQLAAIGVVAGADMTPECALAKLSYLLGKAPDDPPQVRRMMTKNIRGELTVRAEHQKFSATNNRVHVLIDLLASGKFKKTDLDEQTVIPLEEQQLAERALLPFLLCSAAVSNDLEGIKLLYDMVNLNCVDYEGRSPLHVASREGHVRIVEFLLLHGASIHIRDRLGHTPLFVAVAEKRMEVVTMLRTAGAHLAETERRDLGTLWLRAIADGDMKFVKIGLAAGWSVNWAEPVEELRALDVAISHGQVDMVKFLLEQPDMNVHLIDRWGCSAMDRLHWTGLQERVAQEIIDEMKQLLQQHQ